MLGFYTQPATDPQINKLKHEALCCALVLADLKDAVCSFNGDTYHADCIRPHLHSWFENHELPWQLNEFFIITWVIPTADELLLAGGFKTHESEMMFNNLTFDEASYLIQKFVEIKEAVTKPDIEVVETSNHINNIRLRRRNASKQITA